MSYDIFQHKHRFSVWATARAAQRGLANGSTEVLAEAIEQCGVVDFLRSDSALSTNKNEFDALHKVWCRDIVTFLHRKGVKGATFGRAAKLIAVYLKSMVVVGGSHESDLARVAHPPVDRVLLQNMSGSRDIQSPHKGYWRGIAWTELGEKEYYELIAQLGSCLDDGVSMWLLEKYWTV